MLIATLEISLHMNQTLNDDKKNEQGIMRLENKIKHYNNKHIYIYIDNF